MLNVSVPVDPFVALRAREFSRLDEQGLAYLDYAAAGLYAQSQADAYARRLKDGVFGNPHSQHAPSQASEAALERARAAALAFFDADPAIYDLCFTANTSAAIKLVGEAYPFGPGRGYVLAADNHNSINGVREYAKRAGAAVEVLGLDDELRLADAQGQIANFAEGHGSGLFAYPVQSNFSGVRHPLGLVEQAQVLGFDVLLDAAGGGASPGVSLTEHPAEFLVFSFYKLFGLPTGVGALIAKKSALARLRRPWFAGGTVDYVSVEHGLHQLRSGHEAFEDGTPNFLDIAALEQGFALLGQVDQTGLRQRLAGLTQRFVDGVLALSHPGGAPLVRIYGPHDMKARGCIVAFNLLHPNGTSVPYEAVEARARELKVALRGGCFCNPGAAEKAFGFSRFDLPRCFDALGDSFTMAGLQDQLGREATVGALRLSLGLPSNEADIDRAIALVADCADL